MQTTFILDDLQAYKDLFFRELNSDEKLTLPQLNEILNHQFQLEQTDDTYNLSFRFKEPDHLFILFSLQENLEFNDNDEADK